MIRSRESVAASGNHLRAAYVGAVTIPAMLLSACSINKNAGDLPSPEALFQRQYTASGKCLEGSGFDAYVQFSKIGDILIVHGGGQLDLQFDTSDPDTITPVGVATTTYLVSTPHGVPCI